ncbi:bacillithiol biosynthesis cysteine-adding enzyme BshC [Indiicoccus explosivorum]|uniref:bacillithiol biosynthesis cysteine-adding enzyme BshC n=1 Tax=Indiicoccus explosivorum TaxID=1917864 RepID=UPI001F4E15D0|nr:bacillithiol biosynthesis cysteine-adding enzyme BshC [Indiicoccus explosivorum]
MELNVLMKGILRMELEEQFIAPASKLMNDYITGDRNLLDFFEYEPVMASLKERYHRTVSRHPADRETLSCIIGEYMGRFGKSAAAEETLGQFRDGAPLIIAGQQAGLFTGPLYTVHKAVSAIVLAQKATEELGRKVVPLFWIAGEDHDFAEIAHVYQDLDQRVDKLNFPHLEYGRKSASAAGMNKERIGETMAAYFRNLPETAHSREVFGKFRELFRESETFTDFFASAMNWLFSESGLLFMDAADPALRQYERPFFKELIRRAPDIAEAVWWDEQRLIGAGYPGMLEAAPNAANLFIEQRGQRMLLERDGNEFVAGKQRMTAEALLEVAETEPERLSNNVVTRPLMQEMVFPVLGFIGGPGEIAYWAALKNAFRCTGLEMPVVMPRLSMTFISPRTGKLLARYGMSAAGVIAGGEAAQKREQFLQEIRETGTERLIRSLETEIESRYENIIEEVAQVSSGLRPTAEKNLAIHLKQTEFLRRKLALEVERQHETRIGHYRAIEHELLPKGSLQERIYPPVPYLNLYGPDLVTDLLKLPFNYDEKHKIICL